METTGLKRTWIRILLTVMTAAVMALIFCFSMETAVHSDATSGRFARRVIAVLYPDYGQYSQAEQQKLYNEVQHVVRKTAHFCEYLLLGILMRLCFESWLGEKRQLSVTAWLAGTLYACSDELHQLVTDGRSGQWTDVLLDSAGVLAGVLAAAAAMIWLRRKNRKRKAENQCQ